MSFSAIWGEGGPPSPRAHTGVPPRAAGTALLLPVRAALTSGTASPMDLMASTSLTLQPSQNSAVSTR